MRNHVIVFDPSLVRRLDSERKLETGAEVLFTNRRTRWSYNEQEILILKGEGSLRS